MKNPAHLEDLISFLRHPSISTDPAHKNDVAACAKWVNEKLTSIGLDSRIYPTPGHPVLVARNRHQPGRKTVLIYGHYDVQPVDPRSLWAHDPFEPRIQNGRITARGATDNKGQILSHILGVQETLHEKKDLPVNLIFLIEGEEEVGSPNLAAFLQEHRKELACDIVALSDTGMIEPGRGTLTYGLRGITCMEVRITGPDKDLHSGIYGGAVGNPLTVLSRLMATLHDTSGRVAIDGFYDCVKPLETWEREAWSKLPFHDSDILRLTGVPALAPEKGYSAVESTCGRPTAELNGLYGGYQGEGSKTVIPSFAVAKLSFRLVPDQDPELIFELASGHLKKHCPPSVRLELINQHSGSAYVADPHSAFGLAAQSALRKTFPGKEPALVRDGGSVPIVADLKRILGADSLLLGLALPDARIHSPNENFPLENFEGGIRLNRALLEEIAGV
ncbi:MAG: dipeptidase [Methylacidiphilales bacterium]|nr:dipeptidase [Candidatus Methylacidiphilales bacterium]